MRKLTKTALSGLVATIALGAALPAQAQWNPRSDDRYDRYEDRNDRYEDRYDRPDRYDRYDRGLAQSIRVQIDDLQRRIERVDYRDRISEREAAGLRNAVWRLRQQFRDYSRNGLSHREARVLQDRIAQIRARLRYERRDDDGRRW